MLQPISQSLAGIISQRSFDIEFVNGVSVTPITTINQSLPVSVTHIGYPYTCGVYVNNLTPYTVTAELNDKTVNKVIPCFVKYEYITTV